MACERAFVACVARVRACVACLRGAKAARRAWQAGVTREIFFYTSLFVESVIQIWVNQYGVSLLLLLLDSRGGNECVYIKIWNECDGVFLSVNVNLNVNVNFLMSLVSCLLCLLCLLSLVSCLLSIVSCYICHFSSFCFNNVLIVKNRYRRGCTCIDVSHMSFLHTSVKNGT